MKCLRNLISFLLVLATCSISSHTLYSADSCDGINCPNHDLAASTRQPTTDKIALSFVFTESFLVDKDIFWNGLSYRRQRGLSGSHAASIFLAEAMASLGHNVYFIGDNIMFGYVNGVVYMNTLQASAVSCDVLITTYNMNDLQISIKLPKFVTRKIVVLMNNPLSFLPQSFYHFFGPRITFAHVSVMEEVNVLKDDPWMRIFDNILLHNSLNISELLTTRIATSTAISPYSGAKYATSIDMSQKQNQFVFFPCFERGGLVAWEVAQHFPHFTFVTVEYVQGADSIRKILGPDLQQQLVHAHSSRIEIFHQLLRAKYFVYPLVHHESSQIHYDTFGYVVLEALLHGVIVVAPRMACYEELYGDAIAYVEVSDLIPKETIYHWNHKLPILAGEVMIQRYAQKVQELEANQSWSRSLIEKGLKLAEKFDNVRIGKVLEQYLEEEIPTLAVVEMAELAVQERAANYFPTMISNPIYRFYE